MSDPASETFEPAGASWISEPCIVGVDEAGRGPVLGPMVYAVAYCPRSYAAGLAERGYDDSKALSEASRERLLGLLRDDALVGSALESLPAAFISREMLSASPTSLNQVAYASTKRLLEGLLARGVNVAEVYVDTVGDPERYRQRFEGDFPGVAFTVCPKADALYPIVSAASIVAKVTRDRQLREYSARERASPALAALPLGSGYPADPDTKRWLAAACDEVFGFPQLVRHSWATCTVALEAADAAAVEWPHEAAEADDPAQRRLAFRTTATPPPGEALLAPKAAPLRSRKLLLARDAFAA